MIVYTVKVACTAIDRYRQCYKNDELSADIFVLFYTCQMTIPIKKIQGEIVNCSKLIQIGRTRAGRVRLGRGGAAGSGLAPGASVKQ